jgi:hypothetical protein
MGGSLVKFPLGLTLPVRLKQATLPCGECGRRHLAVVGAIKDSCELPFLVYFPLLLRDTVSLCSE